MVKICSHTIVKNSEDFIEPVLRKILPFTTRSIVSIDEDSKDGTEHILEALQEEYPHLKLLYHKVENPLTDLVKERNRQIEKTKEDMIWIVDDDEYYFDNEICDILDKIEKSNFDSYSVKFWFLTDKYYYNPARGKRTVRFYRNIPNIKWIDEFGNEHIEVKNTKHLNNSYIHLSYLKSNSWRKEFGWQYRYSKQSPIQKLPSKICQKLEHFWEENSLRRQKQYGSGS